MMGINSSAVQGLKQGEADLFSLILLELLRDLALSSMRKIPGFGAGPEEHELTH
jgi:hypothetical protein